MSNKSGVTRYNEHKLSSLISNHQFHYYSVITMFINRYLNPYLQIVTISFILLVLVFLTACGDGGKIEALITEETPENIDYGVAILSWTSPTENTDDSKLTDLVSFKIYYGISENELSQTVTIGSASTLNKVIENLTIEQTYYFAVTAVNSLGIESELSDISSKFIER